MGAEAFGGVGAVGGLKIFPATGDDEDAQGLGDFGEPHDQIEAVPVRHMHIGDEEIEGMMLEQLRGFVARRGAFDCMAGIGEAKLGQPHNLFVIVGDQDGQRFHGSGRDEMRREDPRPGLNRIFPSVDSAPSTL